MKKIIYLLLISFISSCADAQTKRYDILSFTPPATFKLKEEKQHIVYEKKEGNSFCQLHIWPAQQGSSDPTANFKTDWGHFAAKPYKLTEPSTTQTEKQNGWDVVTGASQVTMEGISFIVAVSTFTQNDISWCAISIFNDEKYAAVIDKFLLDIKADSKKVVRNFNLATPQNNATIVNNITAGISKSTTNFDDGWIATPANDYVKVTKAGTEVRLHYIDKALDDARPNTVDAPEYYWSKYVTPYFYVPAPEKWSGVQYPVIYFMQGNATNRQTGKSCYVAIKIIYEGGARPVVVISPNQNNFQQQFPHPNDLNKMLDYNKFAVTAKDVAGKWAGGGGGGVEYYSAYSGTYAGMSAVSTADEFIFNSNGSYQSTHNSATMNNSGSKFSALKYNGVFSVTDWALTASNRVSGKTKKFMAQLIAVKGGFLLQLTDSDYTPLAYTLFKTK